MAYDLPAGKLAALLCGVDAARAAQAQGLLFKARSSEDCLLAVSAEEEDGSRYSKMVELAGGNQWRDIEVRFGDLTLDDDTRDENGALDLGGLSHVAFADITGLMQGEGRRAELWLDEVLLLLP
jgi:hypothetical protein